MDQMYHAREISSALPNLNTTMGAPQKSFALHHTRLRHSR